MKKLLLLTVFLLPGCALLNYIPPEPPTPPESTPPPVVFNDCRDADKHCAADQVCVGVGTTFTCQESCLPGIAWCDEENMTCSTKDKQCKHNPTSDPLHCELAPACPETPPEQPPVPPIPPGDYSSYVLPEKSHRGINTHVQGHGYDSTPVVVNSHDYCVKIGYGEMNGAPRASCPLGPDGTELRHVKEAEFLDQRCPSWYKSADGKTNWSRCTSTPHPLASCDHFDLKEVPPSGCDNETGFFTIVHGDVWIKACDKAAEVCSEKFHVNY